MGKKILYLSFLLFITTLIGGASFRDMDADTALPAFVEEDPCTAGYAMKMHMAFLNPMKPSDLPGFPAVLPLKTGVGVVSKFGFRFHPILKVPRLHTGVDFGIPSGTPVLATADGIIEKAARNDNNSGYGRHVVIRHGEEFETLYGHLSRLVVKEGQEIRRGQVIGFSGNTGRSSNPHLHYEVIQDGRKVDPEKFFHIDG